MAAYKETTSVSLRKGNHSENMNFTGNKGEVVVDLGEDGTGVDALTTLRLHNGINEGGISLARTDLANVTTDSLAMNRHLLGDKNLAYADMTNVNTIDLATSIGDSHHEGKNLAYADLSNLEELNPDEQSEEITNVLNTMHSYGLATNAQITELENDKAEKDLSNVDLTILETDFAKVDMTNVDTAKLATSAGHAGKDLTYTDMSNITTTGVNKLITKLTPTFQPLSERKTTIDPTAIDVNNSYPTISAVVDYVDTAVTSEDLLKIDFKNAKTWSPLSARDAISFEFSNDAENIQGGGTGFTTTIPSIADTNYEVPAWAPTNLTIGNTAIKLAVYEVNAEGKPINWRIYPEYGKTNITTQTVKFKTSLGKTLEGTLSSVAHGGVSGVYRYIFTIPDRTKIEQSPEWIGTKSPSEFDYVPLYDCVSDITVSQSVCVQIQTVSDTGAIISYACIPTTSATAVTSSNRTIYHPRLISGSVQSGNNGTITIYSANVMPNIGGAGLLKDDLSNLSGNSAVDRASAKDNIWNINREKPMPDLSLSSIDESEYYRLCTIGQVWKALHEYGSTKVTIRDWE